MVMWDDGTPAPPDANIAPSEGSDPHGMPRSQPAAREQKAISLRTGKVIHRRLRRRPLPPGHPVG